ncbi:MAG: CHASE2 domain-containing protein [Fidelibacterota bacterium]
MPGLVKRAGIAVLIALGVGLLVGWGTRVEGFFLRSMLDGYEFLSYDARMKGKVSGVEEASIEDVVIIDIDQTSIETLGRLRDWPYAYHGQLIDVVTSGNPRALLFDMIFDPESSDDYRLVNALLEESPPDDQTLTDAARQFLISHDPDRFLRSTRRSGKVYHAAVFEQADSSIFAYAMEAEPEGYDAGDHILDIPLEQARRLPTAQRIGNTYLELLTAATGVGSPNFPPDPDGIIRRVPTAIFFEGPGHVFPSLTMAAAMDILDIPRDGLDYDFEAHILTLRNRQGEVVREIPIDDKGRMFVNYYGPFKTFYYLPYVYCFDPELLPPEYWENKIALVGTSLPGHMDLRNTPVQETFAGVEIHANVIHSLMRNEFVRRTGAGANFLVIILSGVVLGVVVAVPRRPLVSLPVPLVGMLGWVVFAYSQFLGKLVMWEIVRPSMTMGLTYLGIFLYNFLVAEKDKRFLKHTFGTYVSPELIDRMYESKQKPQLGGESGIKTAFFTDIQSFSSFSEVLTPTQLVELLNEYLTSMTDILLAEGGTLDKYEGDAIVAFFGAPIPTDDHAFRACNVALAMQAELDRLRKKWKSEGDKWPDLVHQMRQRVGINSGEIVTGNMGSRTRMNYTMMGDVVNTAARLEASAKQYGIYIQVGENTYDIVRDEFEFRTLDYVRVKGKKVPVKVYELLATRNGLDGNNALLVKTFHEGFELYQNQKWDQALEAFRAAEKLEEDFPLRPTNPSRVYIDRCRFFKEKPPGDDWDGVWTLTTK